MGLTFANDYEKTFYSALRIRLVEERIAELYPSDKIQSPVHLSIGQEHLSAALCLNLRADDLVFGTYRSHALYLAKGGSLKAMLAELYGKVTGCGQGRAGSMHLADRSAGVMGASAIVGATIPHAVGAALAAKVRKTHQVAACFIGEGATGQGVYHESLNIAAKRKLPLLFVVENNGLAIFTKVDSIHSFEAHRHAQAYGMRSEKIENGCDLEELLATSRRMISEVRAGEGPAVLEIQTYRYRQHVGPQEDYNSGYRSRSELEVWLKRDPLQIDQALRDKFSPAILREIDEAVEFAEHSHFPTEEQLYLYL